MATKKETANAEAETKSMLYNGASMAQLTALFKIDHRTLSAKIHGLEPCGTRSGFPIYQVSDVASRMGKLTEEQVDAAMKRLNHADLPKLLTKEYWNGLRARQAFQRDEGDLWSTAQIVERASEMVKALKMELDLMPDAVERQTELSDRQRQIMLNLIEGTKANMLKNLQRLFLEPTKPKVRAVVEDDDDEL